MKPSFATLACAAAALVGSVWAEAEWGYKTTDEYYGPEEWSTHTATCGGDRQSPIDISVTKSCDAVDELPLQFSGSCDNYEVHYTTESYKVMSVNGTCSVARDGASYSLAQFHMHAPSEHTVNGAAYDGEVHFVHMNADSTAVTVIGVFLEKDASATTDAFFTNVWSALGDVSEEESPVVNLGSYVSLLEGQLTKGHAYNYPGSLTTPACTEFADWWVLSKPLKVSAEDFENFQTYLAALPATDDGKCARPVQPLNDRSIDVYA